jgi:hypothetical protein
MPWLICGTPVLESPHLNLPDMQNAFGLGLRRPFQTASFELCCTRAARGRRRCPRFRKDGARGRRPRSNAQARRERPIRRLAAHKVPPRDPLPCGNGRTLLQEAVSSSEAGHHLRAAPILISPRRSARLSHTENVMRRECLQNQRPTARVVRQIVAPALKGFLST